MTMTLGLPLLFPAHRAVRDLTEPLGAWPGVLWSQGELFLPKWPFGQACNCTAAGGAEEVSGSLSSDLSYLSSWGSKG